MERIIINTNRDGYAPNQIDYTLTVSDLIEALSECDPDTPVLFGNDWQGNGWYTYGAIHWDDIREWQEDE